ncbi:MAG: hypothetical protein K8I60_07480 [Anaerolineae bacterium]|nr:hypothetical protein [Anaerolineae bacterium]
MRKRALFILIALLLVMPLVIHAEGDPHENACYEGGSMWRESGDGCPTEWHWIVGWYLANWENNGGWSNPDNSFPDWADPEHVLPSRPAAAVVAETVPSNGGGNNNNSNHPSATCIPGIHEYLNFGGGWLLTAPITRYQDASCSQVESSHIAVSLIYAPADYDPDALCNEAFPGTHAQSTPNAEIYFCSAG